jgi:formimidoylglutamate deiminase
MVALHAAAALLPGGWASDVAIEFDGGRIASVTPDSVPDPSAERHAVITPAAGNLHSHAFQRAMSGLAEQRGPADDSFWSWRSVMYKFALSMTPEHVAAVAAQAYVEMLEAGFARVGEFHYLHHDQDGEPYGNIAEMAERIAEASVETGIGLTLLPVLYTHGGFGPLPPTEGQRRFINDVDRYGALMAACDSLIGGVAGGRLGIAPHSLRAATPDEIRTVLPLAKGGPVHIHVAEQTLEVDDCLKAHGARPVQFLLDNLPVDQRWCLIHATHLTPAEVSGIASSMAVVGLCPITEANLGDGIFPGASYFAQNGRFGIGSDSNVLISLAGELRQYEYSQRLGQRARNVIAAPGASTGQTLLERAIAGGAQALGADSGIAADMPADLVSLDVGDDPYLPQAAQLDAWIFGGDVRVGDVWALGRKRVVAGRHVERETIRRRFERTMKQLLDA